MQDYLVHLDSDRPAYADVVHKRLDPKFNNYDTTELVARMKESRKRNSTIVTIGLWPLDFVSYHDWRHSTHASKIFAEYVTMARIEMAIVEDYRASMFKKCAASLFIRTGLASALAEACKPKAWEVTDPVSGKKETKTMRRFVYVDKVPSKGPPLSKAPKVNVVDLKQYRDRELKAQKMAADTVALLKRIENFKGSAAAPNSKKIDPGVARAVTALQRVRCVYRDFLFTLSSHNSHSTRPSGKIFLVSISCRLFWTTIRRP